MNERCESEVGERSEKVGERKGIEWGEGESGEAGKVC